MGDISAGIDSFFWLSLGTLFFGSVGLFVRFFYKSKCRHVKICCIKLTRDVEIEEREDMNNINNEEKI